jgi:aminoglycoside phosphotransferase (APT) family kinase protein
MQDRYAEVLRRIDPLARLSSQRELAGGLSARMVALEWIDGSGAARSVVLRRIGSRADASDGLSAAQHFALLQHLSRSELPVPEPLLLDDTRTLLPEPFLLLGYVPGRPLLAPADSAGFTRTLARQLARIHTCDPAAVSGLLPRADARATQLLAASAADAPGVQLLRRSWPLQARNPARLLHGDFWPGNVLWQGVQLCGVIDWADASFGDPLLDLSIARLELCWLLGEPAMQQFTQAYCAALPCDLSQLPFWDLLAALRPGSKLSVWAEAWPDCARPDVTLDSMQRALDEFIAQALAAI